MSLVLKIRIVATFLVLLSWGLGRFVNPVWLWLAVVIGVNILQSAFTGFSPFETLFKAIRRNKNAGIADDSTVEPL